MNTNKRNQRLIREFGGEVMPFRDLPKPAQLAMAWYMAINGEAWEMPTHYDPYGGGLARIRADFPKLLPDFVAKYGKKKFGYVEIPTDALIEAVMADEEMKGQFKKFAEYHRWYVNQGRMPRHDTKNRWPVILSGFEEETLQDGWHRFHDYVRQGADVIPALYYV